MERLAIMAAKKLDEKQWERTKSEYTIGRQKQVDKARFQQKKRRYPDFVQALQEVKRPKYRVYTRPALLNMVDRFFRTPFHITRAPLPPLHRHRKTIDGFVSSLTTEDSKGVHVLRVYSRNGPDYHIYVLRTPARPSTLRIYPRDTILQVILHDDAILDVVELTPTKTL